MSIQHLEPPKPPVSWTAVHEENDTVEGTVTGREEHTSKQTDQSFTILELVTDDNQLFEVVCGRADLRKFIEQSNPMPGDKVALTFWGERGSRFVYTSAIQYAGDNQVATDVDPDSNWNAPPQDQLA